MDTVHENQQKLSNLHVWLACGYAVVFGSLLVFAWADLTPAGRIGAPITFAILPLLHLVLAMGSRAGSELSRKASVVVGVIMLMAFPVGTAIGFFLLPLTQWKDGGEGNEGQ